MSRPRAPRDQSKPCKCGRPGCIAHQRQNERPSDFRDRSFASNTCSCWFNAQRVAKVHTARHKRARDVDPRLAMAVAMKRHDPKRSIASIARELKMDSERARDAMLEAGVVAPRKLAQSLAAPAWYDRPCGRIVAQRAAQGVLL